MSYDVGAKSGGGSGGGGGGGSIIGGEPGVHCHPAMQIWPGSQI
jgi:hypothetical protein